MSKNKLKETHAAPLPVLLPQGCWSRWLPPLSLISNIHPAWPPARLLPADGGEICLCSVEFVWSCPDPDLWLRTEYDAEQPLMVLRGPPGGGMLTLYRPWREGGGGGGREGDVEFFFQPVRLPQTSKLFCFSTFSPCCFVSCGFRSAWCWEIFSLFGFRTLQALPF